MFWRDTSLSLCWVFVAVRGISLVLGNQGFILVAVHRFLNAGTCLVMEHGL